MNHEQKAMLGVIRDMQATIEVLSDALSDCHEVASKAPLEPFSVSIREIAYQAIQRAHETMKDKEIRA